MTDISLTHHQFDDCLWIRCEGRGCFVNSPVLKSVGDQYLSAGGKVIVVDLELCPGVDSTFMGTLAGLARKCMAAGGGIQVASPTPRTRAAMESLGLDMLMDIDPMGAFWEPDVETRRSVIGSSAAAQNSGMENLSELERTRHVLEAHNTLRSMSLKNNETFGYVCETLEEDLMRQTEQAD
ncbi:MAG: STAS domain-containing protein [Akkermansia sp.]|nr:STAS domain-containing protein [Akkermansia sp.]